MTFKKTLTGIALAAGAMVAPMAKAETKPADTPAKTQEAAQGEKITMPAWIPTTADGKFDEKRAHEQADMLWQENGDAIQKYADDVAAGVPEEIAFTKFAHKLAKGDKEQEKQILSLYDAVKKTREQRQGNMTDDSFFTACNAGGVFLAFLVFSSSLLGGMNDKKVGRYLSIANVTALAVFALSKWVNPNQVTKNTFVDFQKQMHQAYTQQINGDKNYTITDMATARKMIQMAQGVKGAER